MENPTYLETNLAGKGHKQIFTPNMKKSADLLKY
jgi:hypothetical protein